MISFDFYNTSNTFQNFVNNILYKFLNDFIITYLNDILIYFKNKKKHIEYVNKVLTALKKAKFPIDILKCEFYMTEIYYFGFIISITIFKIVEIQI